MNRSADRLLELLPVVLRQRDVARGQPLRALLQVIGEQVDLLERDIEQLYENWFIETCADWVVPYIGELVGAQGPPAAASGGDRGARGALLGSVLAPRRAVANSIRNRRRKGTLALLELLARDAADWPARAVEFSSLLAWMQPLNQLRPERGRTADLRDGRALSFTDGPFDSLAHTVDVRRLGSSRTPGRYNLASVGLFVWRLKAYGLARESAYALEELGSSAFTFSVLGNDAPLFTQPVAEASPYDIAGPLQLPVPISRRMLQRRLQDYYGPDKSFAIWAAGWRDRNTLSLVPPEALIVADLSDWQYRPGPGRVAVDPELGRIVFSPRQPPRAGVWVRYHYGFSDDTGGGEYPRRPSEPLGAVIYRVGEGAAFRHINEALASWRAQNPDHAVVEIVDGGVYTEQINIELREGQSLQLRAAERRRAVLRLIDWHTSRPDALWVRGASESRFALDGLLVTGRSVQCEGALAELEIRHCTLVPGWHLGPDCDPSRPAEPSLELVNCTAAVRISRSILGSIQVNQDEVGVDPMAISLTDSILDATSDTLEAVGAPSWPLAHAVLSFARTTVFGRVLAHAIAFAEDSIFTGKIRVARRQIGCMRFCYVPAGSRTPRRYRCQPDLAEREARAAIPIEAVGAVAFAWIDGGGPAQEQANLRLALEVSGSEPVVGAELALALTLENAGPRDAAQIEVSVALPRHSENLGKSCLAVASGSVQASQGVVALDDSRSVGWSVGPLTAGECAMLSAVLQVEGACEPQTLRAAITSWQLHGEGAAFTAAVLARARRAVVPQFTSTRYGKPGYAQLELCAPHAIRRGASDESELGAFHDLFQPQRAASLEAQLTDSVPAGTTAGSIFAS
jgi:hypothetical protein